MGAWIEIKTLGACVTVKRSHPTMGAWIEIEVCCHPLLLPSGRTPRWVRGLKSNNLEYPLLVPSRTPRWVRGLRFWVVSLSNYVFMSHPTMGAWIEMKELAKNQKMGYVAPHDGCVD